MSNYNQSSSITFNSGQRGLSSILQKLFRPLVQVVKMMQVIQVVRYVMIIMLMAHILVKPKAKTFHFAVVSTHTLNKPLKIVND